MEQQLATGGETEPRPERQRRKKHPALGFIIDAIVAVLAAAILIQWSFNDGRLLLYPAYDDVAYFNGALARLDEFHEHGIQGFITDYARHPPHSPLSNMLGALSFAVFGVHDWAPYAGNGILLLAMLRLLRKLMGDIPTPYRWAAVALVLSTPVAAYLVVEFRPDPFYGLMVAGALVWTLKQPLLSARPGDLIKAGLLWGLIFLLKTSTYPQTLALLGFVVLLRSICDWFGLGVHVPAVRAIRAYVTILAGAVLIAGPHYLLAYKQINYYIYITLFGARKGIWELHGSALDHAAYYLTGRAGSQMFGRHLYILGTLISVCAVPVLAMAPKGKRLEFAGLMLVLLASYMVPTLNLTKSAYLGMVFHFLTILVAVYLVDELFQLGAKHRLVAGVARLVCVLAGCAGLALWSWPLERGTRGSEIVQKRNLTVAELFAALRKHYAGMKTPRLMLTAGGDVINTYQFAYLARKEDHKALSFEPNVFSADLDEFRRVMGRVDFIIAGEPGNGEATESEPAGKIQDQTLSMVRERRDFVELAAVPTWKEKHYYLFGKVSMISGGDPFQGCNAFSGLGPSEGPYPQFKLPVVRCGVGSSTILEFESK